MTNGIDSILGTAPTRPASSASATGDVRVSRAQKLSKRYLDGYRVARYVVGVGMLWKVFGFVFGGIGVLVGIYLVANAREGFDAALKLRIGGLVVLSGIIIFGFCFIIGVLISSVGQMQKATLDSAVNNSTILNDDERAVILSLE